MRRSYRRRIHISSSCTSPALSCSNMPVLAQLMYLPVKLQRPTDAGTAVVDKVSAKDMDNPIAPPRQLHPSTVRPQRSGPLKASASTSGNMDPYSTRTVSVASTAKCHSPPWTATYLSAKKMPATEDALEWMDGWSLLQTKLQRLSLQGTCCI